VHGVDAAYGPFWDALRTARADLVLNGHDHDYERFAIVDPDGNADRTGGARAIVVGTGGKNSTGAVYNAKPAAELASKPVGKWNKYEITVVGQNITVKLNGKVVNEFSGDKKTSRGFIGLQNHDDKTKVSFRNIKIKPIQKKTA
jgi:hypothetical protein